MEKRWLKFYEPGVRATLDSAQHRQDASACAGAGPQRPAQVCREHSLDQSVLSRWRREFAERAAGVLATDLGSSFEHRGRLFFLFGDTWRFADGRDGGVADDGFALAPGGHSGSTSP